MTNLPLGTYMITENARARWTNTDPGGAAVKAVNLSSSATIGGIVLMFTMARRASRLS